MASLPVHHGPWTDWSSGGQYLWTTSSSHAVIWTNLIAFFLGTFVLGACWNVLAFALHRFGSSVVATASSKDGLHRHHRLIWRNVGDPFSTVVELIVVMIAWLRTDIPTNYATTNMSRTWIVVRTVRAMIIPFVLFGGFTAASILTAKIALTGGNVLVKAHAHGQCGFLQYQNGSLLNDSVSAATLLSYQTRVLRDTISGRAYARSCYSKDFASTVSCSFFVRPSLMYHFYQQDHECPFGDATTPFDAGPCNASMNTGAFVMYTDLLDSDLDLGINAKPEHRLTFQKKTTCSVINPYPYAVSTKGYDTSPYNHTYQAYCLGPLGNQSTSTPCNLLTSTFFYNPAEIELNVGYQTNAVVYFAGTANRWQPLDEFRRPDGDTTMVSITANSITYADPVYDPLFLATSSKNAGAGTGLETVYQPYYQLNIMGCVDQYIICNPRFPSRCTPSSGIADLRTNYYNIGLNDNQIASAFRITVMLQNSDTYSTLYATGEEALKASDRASSDLSLALPDDQWIKEVRGWFETGLAKMQAYTVQYAANVIGPDDIGSVELPPVTGQLQTIFENQCASQKIKSSNEFQNLSLTGIIIVAAVGGIMMLIGTFFHPTIVPLWKKHLRKHLLPPRPPYPGSRTGRTEHECDYIADGKYQLYLMAVEDRNKPYRYNLRDECPTFVENPELPPSGERAPSPSGRIIDDAVVYHPSMLPVPTIVAGPGPNTAPTPGGPTITHAQPAVTVQAGSVNIPLSNLAPHASQQALLSPGSEPPDSTSGTSSQGSPTSEAATENATLTSTRPNQPP